MSWLAEVKRKNEVLRLRREALDLAREILKQDPRSEGMTAVELEFAACDLCDRQVNEMKFLQEQGEPSCQYKN